MINKLIVILAYKSLWVEYNIKRQNIYVHLIDYIILESSPIRHNKQVR